MLYTLPSYELLSSHLGDWIMSQYYNTCAQLILPFLNNGPEPIHIAFITVYCYNGSIFLISYYR